MKKITLLVLLLISAFTLTGCNDEVPTEKPVDDKPQDIVDPYDLDNILYFNNEEISTYQQLSEEFSSMQIQYDSTCRLHFADDYIEMSNKSILTHEDIIDYEYKANTCSDTDVTRMLQEFTNLDISFWNEGEQLKLFNKTAEFEYEENKLHILYTDSEENLLQELWITYYEDEIIYDYKKTEVNILSSVIKESIYNPFDISYSSLYSSDYMVMYVEQDYEDHNLGTYEQFDYSYSDSQTSYHYTNVDYYTGDYYLNNYFIDRSKEYPTENKTVSFGKMIDGVKSVEVLLPITDYNYQSVYLNFNIGHMDGWSQIIADKIFTEDNMPILDNQSSSPMFEGEFPYVYRVYTSVKDVNELGLQFDIINENLSYTKFTEEDLHELQEKALDQYINVNPSGDRFIMNEEFYIGNVGFYSFFKLGVSDEFLTGIEERFTLKEITKDREDLTIGEFCDLVPYSNECLYYDPFMFTLDDPLFNASNNSTKGSTLQQFYNIRDVLYEDERWNYELEARFYEKFAYYENLVVPDPIRYDDRDRYGYDPSEYLAVSYGEALVTQRINPHINDYISNYHSIDDYVDILTPDIIDNVSFKVGSYLSMTNGLYLNVFDYSELKDYNAADHSMYKYYLDEDNKFHKEFAQTKYQGEDAVAIYYNMFDEDDSAYSIYYTYDELQEKTVLLETYMNFQTLEYYEIELSYSNDDGLDYNITVNDPLNMMYYHISSQDEYTMISVDLYNEERFLMSASAVYENNQWHHIRYQFNADAVDGWTEYIDGEFYCSNGACEVESSMFQYFGELKGLTLTSCTTMSCYGFEESQFVFNNQMSFSYFTASEVERFMNDVKDITEYIDMLGDDSFVIADTQYDFSDSVLEEILSSLPTDIQDQLNQSKTQIEEYYKTP